MTDTKLLEEAINESGKKKSYLAKKVGVSRAGFYNIIKNRAKLNAEQIDILCYELGITSLKRKESIFFAKNGSFNEPRKEN